MILNQKHRNMKKKDIKIHNKNAFVTGFWYWFVTPCVTTVPEI
jgi:hypothetical protein